MIIKMKRLTLVAHKGDEDSILRALQSTGSVQVIESDDLDQDFAESLNVSQKKVDDLGEALKILKPYMEKGSLLSQIPEKKLSEISDEIVPALSISDSLQTIMANLSRTRTEIEKNESMIASLRLWEGFPEDMSSFQNSKYIKYYTGLLGSADEGKLKEIEDICEYQIFGDGAVEPCVVGCTGENAKSIASFLKSIDWTDYAFPKISGTPKEAIEVLEDKNRQLDDEKQQLEQDLAQLASGNIHILQEAYDGAIIERDRSKAFADLSYSASTFHLEGWVPDDRTEDVKKAVSSVTDAYYLEIRDPGEQEVAPSVVRNKPFSEPFEAVTNLYSRPDPKGIDGTPYMAPFYVLLFGLMLSDTGYGLALAVLTGLFIKLKNPRGMTGSFARVIFWGGLSTIVWGFLVGTFFGVDFDVIFGTKNVFPLLVDPMDNPIGMLILCFGLGVLHILFGVGLKMKMAFRDGDWQTAIFDNFSWILIVIGLILFAGGPMITSAAIIKTVGMVMAIAGAVMILLFKGRQKKNVFSRTISGLGELYQVTSYLSDILSYARLFALGIATGVIASVFNDLCSMLMGSPNIIVKILGVAIGCVLLVGLHTFNIAINTLGAFVHCARLQYVEFYGKFYEAGGKEFRPLTYNTRHVRIAENN